MKGSTPTIDSTEADNGRWATPHKPSKGDASLNTTNSLYDQQTTRNQRWPIQPPKWERSVVKNNHKHDLQRQINKLTPSLASCFPPSCFYVIHIQSSQAIDLETVVAVVQRRTPSGGGTAMKSHHTTKTGTTSCWVWFGWRGRRDIWGQRLLVEG